MNIGTVFLRTSAIIILVGMVIGNGMGMSQDFRLAPAHAHLNVIGWLGFFCIGLYYRVNPAAAAGRLPIVHYWLALAGVLILVVGIGGITLNAGGIFEALAAIGGVVSLLAAALFAYILFKTTASA